MTDTPKAIITDKIAYSGGWDGSRSTAEKLAEQIVEALEAGGYVMVEKRDDAFGCHVEADIGEEIADDCVLDHGDRNACIYAKDIGTKWQCKYWRHRNPERPTP